MQRLFVIFVCSLFFLFGLCFSIQAQEDFFRLKKDHSLVQIMSSASQASVDLSQVLQIFSQSFYRTSLYKDKKGMLYFQFSLVDLAAEKKNLELTLSGLEAGKQDQAKLSALIASLEPGFSELQTMLQEKHTKKFSLEQAWQYTPVKEKVKKLERLRKKLGREFFTLLFRNRTEATISKKKMPSLYSLLEKTFNLNRPYLLLQSISLPSPWEKAVLSPDGEFVLALSNGKLFLYSIEENGGLSKIGSFSQPREKITAMAFSAQNNILALGFSSGMLDLIFFSLKDQEKNKIKLEKKERLSRFIPKFTKKTGVGSITFSTGGLLAAGYEDGLVNIWSMQEKIKYLRNFQGKAYLMVVRALAFSSDNRWLVSSTTINYSILEPQPVDLKPIKNRFRFNMELWPSAQFIDVVGQHPLLLGHAIAVSPDGLQIASSSYGNPVVIRKSISRADAPLVGSLGGHTGEVISLAYLADGERIRTLSKDSTIKTWGFFGQENRKEDSVISSYPYHISFALMNLVSGRTGKKSEAALLKKLKEFGL